MPFCILRGWSANRKKSRISPRDIAKFILPRAHELGIEKRFGWHSFRHTYSTLLRSVGTEFQVMQDLLRHSSMRSTLDVYTQAITPSKHAAQDAVLSLVLSARGIQPAARFATNSRRESTQKGHKRDTDLCPFAPSMISAHSRKLIWNVWRGRRGSNPRPLP